MRRLIVLGVLIATVGGAAWWWHSAAERRAAGAPPGQPAVPVTTGRVEAKDMPVYVRGLGTVQAFNTVSVKSRVDGQITEVHFTEGQEVSAGDPLFQIDPRPYQTALQQAQANKQRDEAQLKGAQLDLERYSKLLPQGFQTRQSYDQQTAAVGQAQGAVKADEALIEGAQLNLRYARITSPIAGRTGARLVDIGNYIQASQGTALVVVTQIKPIFVSFTVPQDSLDEIRRNQDAGTLAVEAYASDDKTLLSSGKLTLIDNQVDVTTGTVRLKATFANGDERLWPGEFVSARLVLSTRRDAPTVPEQTVMHGPDGAYVYVVRANQTVERRPVQVASVQDGVAVIAKGVAAGDEVVVDGQYRLTNGTKVRTASQQARTGPQPTEQ